MEHVVATGTGRGISVEDYDGIFPSEPKNANRGASLGNKTEMMMIVWRRDLCLLLADHGGGGWRMSTVMITALRWWITDFGAGAGDNYLRTCHPGHFDELALWSLTLVCVRSFWRHRLQKLKKYLHRRNEVCLHVNGRDQVRGP